MTIKIYDPDNYRAVIATIAFDPAKYKTKSGAAKAFHKALCKMCRDWGLNPDIEIFIDTPEQSEARGYGRNWRVCWESGPFEWGIHASIQMRGPWGYCEPYHSFDLCFTE